jgi:hypothetical protein
MKGRQEIDVGEGASLIYDGGSGCAWIQRHPDLFGEGGAVAYISLDLLDKAVQKLTQETQLNAKRNGSKDSGD